MSFLLQLFVDTQKEESPLHIAAKLQRYSEQLAQMLLRSGIKIDQKDRVMLSPMFLFWSTFSICIRCGIFWPPKLKCHFNC